MQTQMAWLKKKWSINYITSQGGSESGGKGTLRLELSSPVNIHNAQDAGLIWVPSAELIF